MIYTFSIEKNFFDYFKDNLDSRDARTIIDFITGNFINRDNFFLKGDRKTIFKQTRSGFISVTINNSESTSWPDPVLKNPKAQKNSDPLRKFQKQIFKTTFLKI